MFIPVPESGFFSIPDPNPGYMGQKSIGSRIPDPDPQHCFGEISITGIIIILGLLFTVLVRIRTGTALFYGGASHFSSSLLHRDLDTNKAERYCWNRTTYHVL
jgi:hypothetical protein